MVVIVGARASAINVSGKPGVVASVATGECAENIIVYGLPGLVLEPEVPSTAPDAVRARVLTKTGTFICHLPHTKGLSWTDEHNSAGTGSIDVTRYDDLETKYPTIWANGNHVVVTVGNTDVFRIVLDAEPGYSVDQATAQRTDSRSGLGALGVLNSGMLIPEYGWRPEAADERTFDYGSNPNIGGWLVASEWRRPIGKLVRSSWRWSYKKRHLPKGWPDRKAQWLWWKNPDGTGVPDEICYFRSSFTLAKASRVKFWVCGDDTLEFQVDGEVRATAGPGDWRTPTKIVLQLAAGTHYVAAKVQNSPATDGNSNRSGFLCTIARVQSDGDIVAYVRRSNPATWTVRRQMSGPPGWFPAQILKRLTDEQIARNCAGHSGITYGFSTTKDSAGSAWTSRRDMSLAVESLGLEWLQRLVEQGVDVAMTPGMKLNAWRRRGADRSRGTQAVRLTQVVDESGAQTPAIRNYLAARSRTGWVARSDSASIAANGLREAGVSLGSARSSTQTSASLGAMLPDLANPPQTITVKISGAVGPQPYKHFNVADWIGFKRSGATTWGRFRVMSIAGEVDDTGLPLWTLQLFED
ncbi:MAG: hypothetical protein J7518_20445 [Nocardioidaceae bacterium]|nr:hypothetical protein [Nocardioidaceae bacterium]